MPLDPNSPAFMAIAGVGEAIAEGFRFHSKLLDIRPDLADVIVDERQRLNEIAQLLHDLTFEALGVEIDEDDPLFTGDE